MRFPNSGMTAAMSVFDPGKYKKAHRHGPGWVIVIPAGEGYTVLWEEGKEKIICPGMKDRLHAPWQLFPPALQHR